MTQEQGASANADRATAVEPVPVSPLRASVPSASEQCTMGVGCDQYGVCYADAHGRPDQCPHAERELERFAWGWLDALYTDVTGGRHANDRDYSADEMVDAFIEGHAQAIEARRAETGMGSVHESAVGNADAPEHPAKGDTHDQDS